MSFISTGLNVVQYVSQVSSRITRQSVNNLLFVPKAKTVYYRRSFVISSCNLWNNMSNEINNNNNNNDNVFYFNRMNSTFSYTN
jgi:hypothetical protein